jgi:hypothetical protein
MDEKTSDPSVQGLDLQFERGDDFESLYANNVRFESSVWDLKLIFGELDQSRPLTIVRQHTSISIPWIQAKLLAYFIEVNIGIFESDNGFIRVPSSVTPPLPATFVPADQSNQSNPILEAYVNYFTALHNRFFPDAKQQAVPSGGERKESSPQATKDEQP